MEKGIEAEEDNLYKQTDELAENVTDRLQNINGNVQITNGIEQDTNSIIDYNKMANAMLKALTGCKFTLVEDGFVKIVKDELYKVV